LSYQKNPKVQLLNFFRAGNQGLSEATVVPSALAPTTLPFKLFYYDILMDNRLNYHTSTNITTESKGGVSAEGTTVAPLKPWFPSYHTSLQSPTIALENLKKFNKKLDEDNVLTNAFLANNSFLNDEQREIFNKQMKEKALQEYEYYSQEVEKIKKRRYINGNICGNENSCSDITKCEY